MSSFTVDSRIHALSDKSAASTLGAEIRHHAQAFPERTAMLASGIEPLTYRELWHLIERTRAHLRTAGLGRDARIVVAIPNWPQAALAIVAVACSAACVPFDPRQSAPEIEARFKALRPDGVLLFKDSAASVQQVSERMGLKVIELASLKDNALAFTFAEPSAVSSAPPVEADEPDPDQPAFILQTSGTTGEPKLIPFSHKNMLAAAARYKTWYNLNGEDRCLSVIPPWYSHGLRVTVFTPLLTGGAVVFPKDAARFDYEEWFGTLRPTWYSAGPSLHRLIFDQAKLKSDAKSGHALRFITGGGAPLAPDVLYGLQDTLGVPVLEHFGCSEAGLTASNQLSPGRSKPGTCGIPWPGTVIIVGDDGRRLGTGEPGEILIGGETLIAAYLNNTSLNQASFVDGWFKTGDIGSLDEDGFLTLHGRKTDLINRGGEKISPTEIDSALTSHHAIAEAAAFAVPHPRLGEDVAAAIVFRPGMTATPAELRTYLRERLAPYKIPQRIFVHDQLPKGQTGKVVRRQLTEEWVTKTAARAPTAAPQPAGDETYEGTLATVIREVWERLLEISPLSIDDNFFENGGDSLLATQMLLELERLTGRRAPIEVMFEAQTIGQLAEVLSAAADLDQRKAAIRLNKGGSQTPFFFFHGDYLGGTRFSANLARALGADQPLIAVVPHGADDEPIPPSIEAMATEQARLIMEIQPTGPYRLCGFCVGGIVAFEVARLLLAAGKEVQMVGMIDSPTVNARRAFQWRMAAMRLVRPFAGQAFERKMRRTWERSLRQLDSDIAESRRTVRLTWAESQAAGMTAEHPKFHGIQNYIRQYSLRMSNYFPKPLPVPVISFTADHDAEPWRRMATDLEIVELPCIHDKIYEIPAELASKLRTRLQAGS